MEAGDESNAKAEKFLADMPQILASTEPPEARYSESKCRACSYYQLCKPQFEAKEELTLLYGIESRAATHLEAQSIDTISKLASMQPEDVEDVTYLKGIHKKYRAVMQAKANQTSEMS